MHLQHQPRASPSSRSRRCAIIATLMMSAALALHDGVHGQPLAQAAGLPVRRAQLGDGRRRPNSVSRSRPRSRCSISPPDELVDLREPGQVDVDEALRLLARNPQLLRQPEGADAVDDAEVDGLGAAALVAVSSAGDCRGPRRRSRGGCPRRARTPPSAPARPRCGRGCAARSGSSRPTAARARRGDEGARGSRGRAACGSGCSAGSGGSSESGPVAAVVWLNVVCSRPSRRRSGSGSGSR